MTGSGDPDGSLFGRTPPGDVEETVTVSAGEVGGFDGIVALLADRLGHLATRPGQHNVVLEFEGPAQPYYVQAIVDQRDGVWVEALSNDFIEDEATYLSPVQERALLDLGFHPPGLSPNFTYHVGPPVSWSEVARLFVEALRSVYGATEDDEMVLQIYPHHRTGGDS